MVHEYTEARATAGYDRRKHPRLKVDMLDVSITMRPTLSADRLTARLIDVSLGGCCVALPLAEADILQENGACRCALPVGLAGYSIDYAAAVVARRGEVDAAEQFVHLCFNGITLHSSNLLVRWMQALAEQIRAAHVTAMRATGGITTGPLYVQRERFHIPTECGHNPWIHDATERGADWLAPHGEPDAGSQPTTAVDSDGRDATRRLRDGDADYELSHAALNSTSIEPGPSHACMELRAGAGQPLHCPAEEVPHA